MTVTVNAEALRLLHRIHQQLSDLRDRLERGPKQIRAHEANVARLEAEAERVRQETKAARVAADSKQLQLKTGETKIEELKNKLNACSSNREYQALLEQIAADKMANSVLEDEILEALDKIEELQADVHKAEQQAAGAVQEAEKVKTTVREQESVIKGDVARLEAELTEAEKVLPAEFRDIYDRVLASKGSDGMAPLEGEYCSGCHQQIQPNAQNQLHLSQVVFCSACGRLLYLPEDRSPGS